jgi:DNA-binding CsgD family transcriptional regulator
MATSARTRRRSRGPGRGRLVEREWELAALEQCLESARARVGSVVFVEAPAGEGKSRLLTAAGDMARQANMRVLAAQGAELERDFPFGVALQLFEPLWLRASIELREQLLDGPAQLAAALLNEKHIDAPRDASERQYPVVHGLFWATRNLVQSLSDGDADGVAMVIDDAHWADRLSLRFLAYLADRNTELPIAIILAARAGEPSADPQALAVLRGAGAGSLLRPAPLSADGVLDLVRRRFPTAEPEFCAACATATGANPFLLTELLEELAMREQAPTASAIALAEVVPESVGYSVGARLDAMQPATRRVAQSLAVLGGGASVRQVARLAELDSKAVLVAADALAAMDVLTPGMPLSFAQPLIESAVLASVPQFRRALAHLEAAAILHEQHANAEEIVHHLLRAPADDDATAIVPLRESAARALQDGNPERAVKLLERALAEHPDPELRVELLAELGRAATDAGYPGASERLSEARRISEHPGRRAELALDHGYSLYARGLFEDAANALQDGLDELADGDPELAGELTAAYVSAASLVRELRPRAMELRDRMLAELRGAPGSRQRAAIAHTIVHDGLLGEPQSQIRRLAELAWGDGALLGANGAVDFSAPLLCAGLVFADELELAVAIGDKVLSASSPDGVPAVLALVRCARAWAFYHQGRLIEAAADANTALNGAPGAPAGFAQSALAMIVCCHIERGDLEQAESALALLEHRGISDSISHALQLHVRAQLRLAEHRPQEALQDAVHAGLVIDSQYAGASPGAIPWRSTAALAHLALGAAEPARALVEDELLEARRIGLARIVIRDLRILGLLLNSKGLKRLAEAVQTGDSNPGRLEHIRALIDHGAALRRKNRRAAAREPLRRGLDLSHKVGASVLATRAQTELIATGARPRRPASSGIDSLTVSQRRVAELAATGLTTRQIAETLFVTGKTVEYHLRQTYRKLDISSRAELSEALSAV